jgi:hypothetical protein
VASRHQYGRHQHCRLIPSTHTTANRRYWNLNKHHHLQVLFMDSTYHQCYQPSHVIATTLLIVWFLWVFFWEFCCIKSVASFGCYYYWCSYRWEIECFCEMVLVKGQ